MSKFMVLKNNTILIISIAIIFILINIFFLFKFKSTSTFSHFETVHNKVEFDFDGDGNADTLNVISNNSTYSLNFKSSKLDILLKSKKNDYSLLDVSPYCNIKIQTAYLSRSNIPEVIIMGIKNNIPTTYIFKWNGYDFEEILMSNKNIFGILDYNNSRTPKILDTLSDKGNESTSGYILNNNTLKNINFSSPSIPSLGEIQILIDLIQAEYELSETPDIFSSFISSEELSLLWKLDKETFHYTFINGYFFDSTWDEEGYPTTIYWILSFKKSTYTNPDNKNSEIIISAKVVLDELGEFKISSLKKI